MKKNSSLIIIVILLLLVGLSVYIYTSKGKMTTVDEEDRAFSYRDTAEITSIFIADKEGNKSLVERGKTGWRVNNKYPCRSEAILNLLEVIRNVDVKMPVPKEARESVIKFMSYNALKVEVYSGKEKVKQFYVGHETPDGEGSYMVLSDPETGKNYKDPYVCFIPGFIGYLAPRFIAKENEWRDRLVLNYIPPDLKNITVSHFGVPADSSFSIDFLSTTDFRLTDGNKKNIAFNQDKLKQYIAYYQNISYESLITGKNKNLQDSLLRVKPFCEINVQTKKFSSDVFRFYRKPFAGTFDPELGVTYEYDPDRLYMSFNNDREWAIVQYFVFGKLLVNSAYFQPAQSVKK